MKNLSYKGAVKKGFTLIELLIVITIIGILAAALLPSVLGAPARARDAARAADLNSSVTALEAYNVDKGSYPGTQLCLNAAAFASHLAYFQGGQVPNDPLGANAVTLSGCAAGEYAYGDVVGTPGQSYWLAAMAERPESANATKAAVDAAMEDAAPALSTPATCTAAAPCAYVVIK